MKIFFTLSILFIISINIQAQSVSDEYVLMAKNLREKYPDENMVINNMTDYYTFDIDKNNDKEEVINVYEDIEIDYMAIRENAKTYFNDGYNDEEEIKHTKASISKGGDFKPEYYGSSKFMDRQYKDENIFDMDGRIIYKEIDLATTGLRERINYNKTTKDIRYLSSNHFSEYIPIINETIVITIPNWLKLEIKEFNFDNNNVLKTIEKNEKENTTIITYTAKNIKNRTNEINTPNINKIVPHILFVPQSYTNKAGETKKIFENIGDLFSYYKSLTAKMKNNNEELKPIVEKLINGLKTDDEKIKAIYYYVQDNIKYIAFERGIAGFKPEDAQTVYKNKYGDCKGMANLLTNMLQIAGFDAHLTWIGTRNIAYDYSTPSMAVDNHMICALKQNGKYIFLDGTEKYSALYDYGFRIQGRQALIDEGDKYVIEKVPDLPIERNKFSENITCELQGDKLKSKINRVYNGESKTAFLNIINSIKTTDANIFLQQVLSNNDKNYLITNISQKEFNDREKPINFEYTVDIANQVTNVGNELYIALDNSKVLEEYIPSEKRNNEIEIKERIFEESSITFNIPNGYKVETLPKPLDIEKPNYNFHISYNQVANNIVLKKSIMLKECIIPLTQIMEFRNDLKKLKDINNEQIILNK